MNHSKLLPLSLLLLPAIVAAQGVTNYVCTMDGMQRRVVILTEPGVTVPCQVQYHKDTEAPGQAQVLWTAATQADYCDRKAREFVEELEGWGWSCAAGDSSFTELTEEPVAAGEESSAEEIPADEGAADEAAAEEAAEGLTDDTAALEPAGAE